MNWERATTDDKKSERKEAIYAAALALFKSKGYEKVSFNGIASEAGFTKSNMYRYFSSKEDIFLSIFADLFKDWQLECSERLQQFNPEPPVELFAESWVVSHRAHKEFLDLTPLLFTSLESNSSFEQLQEFKQLSFNLLFQLTQQVGRLYPDIDTEKGFQFLTLGFAATANYWAAESKQNEALQKIYQMPQFSDLKPNFERSLQASIEIIVRGLKAS